MSACKSLIDYVLGMYFYSSYSYYNTVLFASVSAEGSSIAGESLTVICSITRVNDIVGNVTVQWIGPGGTQVISSESVTVGAPTTTGATTSSSLQFSALRASSGGQYTCRGDLVTNDTVYSVLTLQDVIVQGILCLE